MSGFPLTKIIMKKYLKMNYKYLKYLLKHKWYVFKMCCKFGIIWRGITHDISKFYPSEYISYRNWFFGDYGVKFNKLNLAWDANFEHLLCKEKFDYAWLKHIHRNPHHWQHWFLVNDEDSNKALKIPEKYRLELYSDWVGAGWAITGNKNNVISWYEKNKDKMLIKKETRNLIEQDIKNLEE